MDLIQFRPGGGEVPRDEYLKAHAELLQRDAWIIDGFGCVKSAWERWPAGSPMISSTINSYRVIWLCHRHLTPKYRALVSEARHEKRVYHLRSAAAIKAFLNGVKHG